MPPGAVRTPVWISRQWNQCKTSTKLAMRCYVLQFIVVLHNVSDIITFCVSHKSRKMYCGHARLCVGVCVCVSVCLSVRGRTLTLLHGPGCNFGMVEAAP